LQVNPHVDDEDLAEGWVAMMVTGNFEGEQVQEYGLQ
jgi:hypothetical protein